jgi:translation initiation factor 4G
VLQAAKEKAAAERESYGRAMPLSRGGSRRGEHSREYSQTIGPDGWTTTGPSTTISRPPAKAGDLSQFGKINKVAQSSLGPSAVFKKESKSRDAPSLSRSSSSANMFSMLNNVDIAHVEPAPSRGSQPPSRKPSGDFTQSGIPGLGGRKKIQLLPRTIPIDDGTQSPITPGTGSDSESEPEEGEIRESDEEEVSMSREEVERKVKEDVKELFSLRNLDEAEEYFKELSAPHHPVMIEQILMQVLERKEADAKFVATLFERVAEKQLCAPAQFEEGFGTQIVLLDDISVDVPAAYKLMAITMKGTRLPRDAVERLSDKIAVEGDPLILPKEKFLKEYENLD